MAISLLRYSVNLCLQSLAIFSPCALAAENPSSISDTTPKLVADLTALTSAIEDLRNKPSDTIKENGGDMEAAMLSSGAIAKAGYSIAGVVDKTLTSVILGQSDTISLDNYLAYEGEYYGIVAQLKAAKGPSDKNPPLHSQEVGVLPVAAVTGALSLLSSLFRSETEISALAGGLADDRLLALSVAQHLNGKGIVPAAITVSGFKPGNPVYDQLDILAKLREAVSGIKSETPAAISALKHYDDFIEALTKPNNGELLLVSVLKAQVLAAALEANARVIRLHIDKSGGTLLKRKNIGVALGASALGVSGGLVASYSISVPGTGAVEKAGLIVCRTGVMPFKRVHEWDGSKTNCNLMGVQ